MNQKLEDINAKYIELDINKVKLEDRIEEVDPNSSLNMIRKLEGDGIWRYQVTQTDKVETEDRSIVNQIFIDLAFR